MEKPKYYTCKLCDGEREVIIDSLLQECPICQGEGMIEIEYEECPHCRKEVDRQEKCWVKDNYGIPYKKVCYDCYDEVKKEIGSFEYDYLDAGEYLEEEDY